ncbi:MAG: glycosyltransferase family 4 protein [Gemmatimonadetes bacterium]|nr:glycosyltransferase family 4 protein [Gemmatimonadota bacterium]
MRILQQCIYFPPEVGGLESHAYFLCRELVRMGHQVTMMTSLSQPGLRERECMDGVEVVRKWFPRKRTPAGWAAHTLGTVPHYMRLAKHADVLHAQTFASAIPGMRAKRKYGHPLVITLHTSHFLKLAKKPVWRPVLRRIVKSADWLLAASGEIRDVALDLYPHQRAEALTNGVDTELFVPRDAVAGTVRSWDGVTPTGSAAPADGVEPSGSAAPADGVEPSGSIAPSDGVTPTGSAVPPDRAGRPRVLVPRRLFEKNGVEYFIRALPLIRTELEIDAVLVGDGPERERLERIAGELDVTDMVTFMGSRPNDEMPALLADADVAVLPSLMEATSVAALEAMSCGVPVAASRVGGLPEIVDESVGTLFEPADPQSLATALVALLRRPDRVATGLRARERVVQSWSVVRLARRHQEIYETLLRERR